jgi:hypothetical protein
MRLRVSRPKDKSLGFLISPDSIHPQKCPGQPIFRKAIVGACAGRRSVNRSSALSVRIGLLDSEYELAQGDQNQRIVSQPGSRSETAVPGPGACRQEVDHAGAELESGLAALRDFARRSRSQTGGGVDRHSLKNRKRNISGMEALPPNP